MRFSGVRLFAEALRGQRGWKPHWRKAEPRPAYDVIVIGGGGHGLSTAYYLAKNHNIRNVAVIERGALGQGNVGRNTTIVRANYFLPGNSEFYSFSLKLWEGLEQALNFNVMFSQRGLINLFHSDAQRDAFARRGNAMLAQGDDAILLDREGVRKLLPYLDFEQGRFPIYGGLYHPRAGTARHDAVAWGYARAADALGVDLIEHCAVTGIDVTNGRVRGVETTRGFIRADRVAIVVAGRSSQVAAMAGLTLPLESHILQAFVTEGLKPCIDHVVSFGMGHFYISQSDKGGLVFGGDLDCGLIGIGAAIGAVVVLIDELLGKAGKLRLPPLWRRSRFLCVVCGARKFTDGRTCHGGRNDAYADDWACTGSEDLGRDHGYVPRRQPHHR